MTTTALRIRPIPVVEPWPALRVLPDDDAGPEWPMQEVLPLELEDVYPAGPPAPCLARSRGWALRFTQVALEVVAGLRPPGQLARWTCEDVQEALQGRHALALRTGAHARRSRVRSVHVSMPVDGVAEVAAVVTDGVRCRAVAFRMEGRHEHWQVTAMDLG